MPCKAWTKLYRNKMEICDGNHWVQVLIILEEMLHPALNKFALFWK